ncbi:hypothetical protein OSCI_3850008 [Kamptonema sp. PCC 6506]|nr:hypothetical protein OSCI_3850008 [Kamptonema sp. PCC 6506]
MGADWGRFRRVISGDRIQGQVVEGATLIIVICEAASFRVLVFLVG